MSGENPRITELRRRVENDPSSIAFAQLAEEYRRAGNYEAAERYCRVGLQRHPAYLSARVTLGRTLIELNKLEEAEHELQHVLTAAPDNLAALRGVAEIHQRLGRNETALEYYHRALALSRHDPELEEIVERLSRANAPAPPPSASPEEPIDFDALLDSLGIQDRGAPPGVEALLDESAAGPRSGTAAAPHAAPGGDAPLRAADAQLEVQTGDAKPQVDETQAPVTTVIDAPDWMSGPLPDITAPPLDESRDGESAAVSALDASFASEAPDAGSAAGEPDAVTAPRVPDARGRGDTTSREAMILDELEAWLDAIKR